MKEKNEEDIKKLINDKGYLRELASRGIYVTKIGDADYPKKLIPYKDKPACLFYKGRLPQNDMPAVAMVGARACSNYGRVMAKQLAKGLAENGVQIISGMARGIDTYSALGALEGNTPTFAVLGSGVDVCYPVENIELYTSIIKNGGVMSEYPPGSKPVSWHFPRRNRIISALSDRVLVVEAKRDSGSLITVEWALEQGKDVMAVPGRVGEKLSEGCNQLIQAGAGLVTSVEDVCREMENTMFHIQKKEEEKQKLLEKDFSLLYSELSLQPKNIYELMNDTGLKYDVITKQLLKMQLMGIVEQPTENYYSKIEK